MGKVDALSHSQMDKQKENGLPEATHWEEALKKKSHVFCFPKETRHTQSCYVCLCGTGVLLNLVTSFSQIWQESWKVLNSYKFVNMGDVEPKGALWQVLSLRCCRSGSRRFRISGADTRLSCMSWKLWPSWRALAPCSAPRNASAASKDGKLGFDRSPVSGRGMTGN